MSGEAVIVLITMVAFIALYVGIGVYMIVIGRPKLLYGYLCGNADDRDLPKLARLCGYGVLLETLGIAFFVSIGELPRCPGFPYGWEAAASSLSQGLCLPVTLVCSSARLFTTTGL